ncbi:MAG: hypothetical protein IPK67_17875 [Planctomycetes bacterium]|nr:hypothetical protein [Planctomycetota bacterium]
MKFLGRAVTTLIFCLATQAPGAAAATALSPQDGSGLAGISEEQELLARQLDRLRRTMEALIPRLEKEGRPRALELVKAALAELDSRPEETKSRTLQELMESAKSGLASGQAVMSLEEQELIVRRLDRLLSILLDRTNVEGLERSLADLKELKQMLSEAAQRERELEAATRDLAKRSQSETAQSVSAKLNQLEAKQRELLGASEQSARQNRELDLAQLERALSELTERQERDRALLESFRPESALQLAPAVERLDEARAQGARAERLRAAAQEMREAARATRDARRDAAAEGSSPDKAKPPTTEAEREAREARAAREAASALAEEAQREERRERAASGSQDPKPGAKSAGEALRKGSQELDQAAPAGREAREKAAASLEQQARELEQAAAELEAQAQAARSAAAEQLARGLSEEQSVAAEAARAAQAALERAKTSAAKAAASTAKAQSEAARFSGPPGNTGPTGPEAPPGASTEPQDAPSAAQAKEQAAEALRATEESARVLERALAEERALPQALSRSQEDAAAEARRLARASEDLPQTKASAGEQLRQQLEDAAQAMGEASEAARQEQGPRSAEAAGRAAKALESAQASLSEAREGASRTPEAQAAAAQRSAAQQALAKEASSAGAESASAELSQEAQSALEQSLEQAEQAMQRAAARAAEGRDAAASSEQREALEKIAQAKQALEQGARPTSEAGRQEAAAQARTQEEIKQQLLELAKRNQARKGAKPSPGLDQAATEAQAAKQSLEQGELSEAEEAEQRVQKQLEQARQELEQEEDEYQRLRQEELLFKIGEELENLARIHGEAMTQTRELDAKREAGARPSRAQRLALKRIAKDEAGIAARAGQIADALQAEQTVVFTEALRSIASDLQRLSVDLDESGDWESGERVQLLQSDVERDLQQLIDALKAERQRREDENRENQGQKPPEEQQGGKEPLVADSAEIKLLAARESGTMRSLERLLALYPELSEPGAAVDPRVLQDVQRLAEQHERITVLFASFRKKLGLPDPSEQ